MRFIGTIDSERKGQLFSRFLDSKGILNHCEIAINRDWGSPGYGDLSYKIWIYDEDKVEEATRWFYSFNQDPHHPQFDIIKHPLTNEEIEAHQVIPVSHHKKRVAQTGIEWEQHPMGTITFSLLLVCIVLFLWGILTRPPLEKPPPFLAHTPLVTPQVNKQLLYDYPYAFTIVDRLVLLYGTESLHSPQELPSEGRYLLAEYLNTPYWQGVYDKIFIWYHDPKKGISIHEPLFEKIQTGEWWRLFTPCLLHYDLFHIFFNMLWLVMLGKQMERRIGPGHYLFFLLATGIFSNTAQYLMSGSNFVGFSGILCAMITFIWMRQKVAPWEGYPLQRATFTFVAFFILAMFALQLVAFFTQLFFNQSFSIGIANTAHLSGALVGAVLGRLNFFAWKER